MLLLSIYIGTPPVIEYRWMNPGTTAYMRLDNSAAIQKRWVNFSKISPYLKRAVVASEDDLFYTHCGIDWAALRRAAETNIKREKYSHGGSTITMQLARNLFLSPRKSLIRKGREMLIALELELWLPKTRILEMYLNVAEWGNGIYGIWAASQHYFDKAPSQLTAYESAFLAAILPRPRYYDINRDNGYLSERIEFIESRIE
jgi:monofunctional glycosyltransferase